MKNMRPGLASLVGSLDRLLRRQITAALAPLGLTLAQFTVLSVLEARGETSNAELAERSFMTPQAANEVMSAMAARNWITRKRDPDDGRFVVLRLTGEGRDVLHRCTVVILELEARMMADVEPDVASAIYAGLKLFIGKLRR